MRLSAPCLYRSIAYAFSIQRLEGAGRLALKRPGFAELY